MINLPERPPTAPIPKPPEPLSLLGWWQRTVGTPQVQVRRRGNILYVLCEGLRPPVEDAIYRRAFNGLSEIDLQKFSPKGSPELYQVVLYGKALDAAKPEWAATIALDQLPNYRRPKPTSSATPKPSARQGDPDAIARHLSETLSGQGIAVKAQVITITPAGVEPVISRLLVNCESAYSPDPSALAESLAQRIRDLNLVHFRDALITSQVQGETKPDWKLRIDLTPQRELLMRWARWGDKLAFDRLLTNTLRPIGVEASARTVDMVLHITCWKTIRSGQSSLDLPIQPEVTSRIKRWLEVLAPQGIHSFYLYGSDHPFTPIATKLSPLAPGWQQWAELPAATRPALAESTEDLAKQGDLSAIGFLLMRPLNLDLDRQLATGGIRIQARHREDLIHIMADGPVSPSAKLVLAAVQDQIQPLKISGVNGVRVYGRRAGEKKPQWKESIDFRERGRLVPEATPEFAASEAFVGDLITHTGSAIVFRPDLSPEENLSPWAWATQLLRQGLLATHLFTPAVNSRNFAVGRGQGEDLTSDLPVAMVWGAIGVLGLCCADWGIGLMLPPKQTNGKPAVVTDMSSLAGISLSKTPTATGEAFNPSTFTGKGNTVVTASGKANALMEKSSLPAAPLQPKAIPDLSQNAEGSFNAPQMDEKLALYRQYVAQSGVPDVMVLGSSRALRGVDPVALQEALASQGFSGVKIFNFGVNGSTAQVVDLTLRRLIKPEQLPKLIVWADGARALNSGRADLTFETIAKSPGYQKWMAKSPEGDKVVAAGSNKMGFVEQYNLLNQRLSGWVTGRSQVYEQRDLVMGGLFDRFTDLVPSGVSSTDAVTASLARELDVVDVNGFLPLSLKFNPVTYYQKYSRVPGNHDADYVNFSLQGKQSEAVKVLAAHLKAHKKSLVFVNLPMTADYLDVDRRSHEDAFQQFMIQTAATEGFTYRNLGDRFKTQNDYFSDPSHLNRYGAFAVSHDLARDPLIPWGAQ
jgi:hypothetical protein